MKKRVGVVVHGVRIPVTSRPALASPPAITMPCATTTCPVAPTLLSFPRSPTGSVPSLPTQSVPVTPVPVAASVMPAGHVPSTFRVPNFFLDHASSDFVGALSATSAGARELPSPLFSASPPYPAALRQYFSLEDFPALSTPSAGALSAVSGPIPSPLGTILPPTYAYPAAPGAAPALIALATLNLDHLGRLSHGRAVFPARTGTYGSTSAG